jgi:hypothetical protein
MSKTFRRAPVDNFRKTDSDMTMNQLKKLSRTKQAARQAKEAVNTMNY